MISPDSLESPHRSRAINAMLVVFEHRRRFFFDSCLPIHASRLTLPNAPNSRRA